MLKISNVQVYGMDESIKASGYPMLVETEEFQYVEEGVIDSITSTDTNRAKRLGNVEAGSGHNSYLKGIIVQADIKYPQYWTPQFQRYHFSDIISSCSKMHRLTKMSIKESCNKYVDDIVIDNLNMWVNIYNRMKPTDLVSLNMLEGDPQIKDEKELKEKHTEYYERFTWLSHYDVFMKCISNTPMGLEMSMRITSNYLQNQSIYHQRKHHKLTEDWGPFCAWCESLPNFVDFCLGGKRMFTDENGEPLKPIWDWRV